MKKVLVFMLLLIGFTLFSQEVTTENRNSVNLSKMKISIDAGLSYGVGDAYEYTDMKLGFNLGGIFHYNLNDVKSGLSVEGILNYTYYSGDSVDYYDYSYGMLEILAGANYSIIPQLNVLGGLGLYRFMFEMEYTGPNGYGRDLDESETDLGLWGGISYSLNESLSVRATLHLPDFDPDVFYLRLNAVYSFAF